MEMDKHNCERLLIRFNRHAFFIAAFFVRLFYSSQNFRLAGDSADYLNIAHNLETRGSFALTSANGEVIPTAFRAFLYPFFLFLLGSNENLIIIAQSILGAATVVLTYNLGRRISREVALISAVMMTFAPMTIALTATVLSETLFMFLVTFAIYLWSRKRWKSSGALFGLAALAKPVIFPFLIFLLMLAFIIPNLRVKFNKYAVVVFVALLVSSFWIARNSLLMGQFTLTQAGGYGTNLLFGTIETKVYDDSTGVTFFKNPLMQVSDELNNSEKDKVLAARAIERIKADPVGWLRARARQYPHLYLDSGESFLGNYNKLFASALSEGDYFIVAFKSINMIASLLFLILALAGVYTLRGHLSGFFYLWSFPVFLAIVHLPLWIEARYFLPASPVMCVLAAAFICRKRNENCLSKQSTPLKKNQPSHLITDAGLE
jgi:4-amino-4-deoxy-L-arabinose transferase-like glycosyltransferase